MLAPQLAFFQIWLHEHLQRAFARLNFSTFTYFHLSISKRKERKKKQTNEQRDENTLIYEQGIHIRPYITVFSFLRMTFHIIYQTQTVTVLVVVIKIRGKEIHK